MPLLLWSDKVNSTSNVCAAAPAWWIQSHLVVLSKLIGRFMAVLMAASVLLSSTTARGQCEPQWLPGDGVLGVNGRVYMR